GQHPIRAIAIGFVDHEDVSNFHQAGFHHLHAVAGFRHQDDDHRIRRAHHIEFGLAYSYRLNQYIVPTRGVKQFDHILGCSRHAAVAATGRHAADKHALVEVMLAHADTITQERATGKWAGGVNSNHSHSLASLTHEGSETINHTRLSRPRRASDTDGESITESGRDSSENRTDFAPVALGPGPET